MALVLAILLAVFVLPRPWGWALVALAIPKTWTTEVVAGLIKRGAA